MSNPTSGPISDPKDEDRIDVTEGPLALARIDKAAIDIQIATARAFPRSVSKALIEAESLALLDEDTAESMFYALPRGKNDDGSKKFIEGPSVRLAELLAYSWSNLRVDSGILSVDARALTAQSTTFDLEKNVAVRVQVNRNIWGRYGRFNDDMIGVTSQAAISIALRNSVFRVIPRVYVERIYEKARLVAMGNAGSFTKKRDGAMDWFKKAGIEPSQIYAVLGIRGLDDLQGDQYLQLRGLYNAIKSGEASLEATFSKINTATSGAAAVNASLKQEVQGEAPASAPGPTPPDLPPVPAAAPVEQTDAEIAAEDARILAADKARGKKS